MADKYYFLPCSPDIMCEDRLSILDSEELQVPLWDVLQALLTQGINSTGALIDILETISVTRTGKSNTDYGTLREHMEDELPPGFYSRVWPQLVGLALSMPALFPSHCLTICTPYTPKAEFSRRQVACLVVHQFLCTLAAPRWQDGYQDFHIWYSSYQPHPKVVRAYLTSLLTYFTRIADDRGFSPLAYDRSEWPIVYNLQTGTLPSDERFSFTQLEVVNLPQASTEPSFLGLLDGAAVISANKFIGFGQTGTQEETHVGASPECCPAVLITPPLADDQAQVIRGPEAMVSISGYGRDAYCAQILPLSKEPLAHSARWSARTMLFVDALELDLDSNGNGLPDLLPGRVRRELTKAYIGLQSGSSLHKPLSVVYTGYWGCRTFGGNVAVKSMIQWCAASLAGCNLRFVCSNAEQHAFGADLQKFVEAARRACPDRADLLMQALLNMTPELDGHSSALSYVLDQLVAVKVEDGAT